MDCLLPPPYTLGYAKLIFIIGLKSVVCAGHRPNSLFLVTCLPLTWWFEWQPVHLFVLFQVMLGSRQEQLCNRCSIVTTCKSPWNHVNSEQIPLTHSLTHYCHVPCFSIVPHTVQYELQEIWPRRGNITKPYNLVKLCAWVDTFLPTKIIRWYTSNLHTCTKFSVSLFRYFCLIIGTGRDVYVCAL